MKNKFLTLFLLLSNVAATFAGNVTPDWLRSVTDHSESDASIVRDASNNVYIAGSLGGLMYLTKRDRFGNFQWEVTSTSGVGENATRVFIDPQGNPVMVGYQYSTTHEGPFAVSLILLKYDPNGNLIYKKSLDGTYSYFNNSANRTNVVSEMDASGNVYIASGGIVSGYPKQGFNVVKYSPAGQLLWVSTQTFNNSGFYLIGNVCLKGNKIGVEGTTLYWTANASTWVLDTTGASKWFTITNGYGGNDFAFDNSNNAYAFTQFANVAGPATGTDLSIYKYNNNGKALWLKGFDFTGDELGGKIKLAPDGNLVIVSGGNQTRGNPGSLYMDWLTVKFDLNGNLLWSKRYDKTGNNDEFAGMFTMDSKSNIYITGYGGPFPGGSNLGATQGVTLKYNSDGTLAWTTLLDTLNFNGVSIVLGSDTSVFALAGFDGAVAHYIQTSGTDACSVPGNLSTTNILNDGATVNWDAVPNTIVYHVEYKTATGNVWIQLSTDVNHISITGLTQGTLYDYRIEAICNSGATGFSPSSQFTTLGSGYCSSKGLNAKKEWIDLVLLGAISSSSESDGGYGDFTYLSTNLAQGSSNEITLSAGMDIALYTETWRVWIDFNGDGDFADAKEKVVGYKSQQIGWESHTFTVPATAKLGATRMRVSMKKGGPAQGPCETFNRGEVEDYTVNIVAAGQASPANKEIVMLEIGHPQISVYPNPAASVLNADLSGWEGKITVQVFDLFGKLVATERAENSSRLTLDVHQWSNGIYLLKISDEKGHTSSIKWVKD